MPQKKQTGRAKPNIAKNAYTKTKRKYACGGKLSTKKKSV